MPSPSSITSATASDVRLGEFIITGNHVWSLGTSGGIRVVNTPRALEANEWAGADVVIANNTIESNLTRCAIHVEAALNVTVSGIDVAKFVTTLPAPCFIRDSINCVLSGQNGTAELAGNGATTHTVVGIRRNN